MNPIYWLTATKPFRHLSNHFILKAESKFMVFTSKPISGLKMRIISEKNIEARNELQYIAEKIHEIDYTKMIITSTEKGLKYYIDNKETLDQLIELITK